MSNPVNPPPPDSPDPMEPIPPPRPKPLHPGAGQFEAKPLTWLGMTFDPEQAQKLWNIITQMVNNQIQKDEKKAIKAIKNFGKEPGDPDYED